MTKIRIALRIGCKDRIFWTRQNYAQPGYAFGLMPQKTLIPNGLMPSRWSRLTIVLVSIFACAPQTRSETARPKIGLVLSGGAARAAAHVGVLKALEELRVPVDCIAGTSMGGVVGGLYASGMSPDEIESWFGRVDWRELFSDQAPRYPSPYSTKERDFDLNQNVELSISAKKGLKFPSGFIAGQNLLVTLRELLLPVREVHDFDQLRIPFRAVATDIETGDKIVLSRGDLVGALRATMSVPAVFTPYKIGDRLLIDGGVSSNLPIDAAREMGADRIIAVDVHAALKKESELDTITAVADQLLEIVTQKDTRAQIATLGAGDLYIYLKMEGASLSDFDRVAQNIDEGYRETMKRASVLRAFAVSDAEYASFLVRQRLARENSVQISFLKMDTPAGPGRHELRRPIPFTPGDPLAFAQLEEPFAGARRCAAKRSSISRSSTRMAELGCCSLRGKDARDRTTSISASTSPTARREKPTRTCCFDSHDRIERARRRVANLCEHRRLDACVHRMAPADRA
jgi:NTE family protein